MSASLANAISRTSDPFFSGLARERASAYSGNKVINYFHHVGQFNQLKYNMNEKEMQAMRRNSSRSLSESRQKNNVCANKTLSPVPVLQIL